MLRLRLQFLLRKQILYSIRERPGMQGYRIGTWNIRSLYKPDELKSISDAVKKYKNVQIVALQEFRWSRERDVRANKITLLFYIGTFNGKHENEIGFIVNDQIVPSIKK